MRLDTVKIYASTIWTHSFVALSEDLYIATHMNYVTNALYGEIFFWVVVIIIGLTKYEYYRLISVRGTAPFVHVL